VVVPSNGKSQRALFQVGFYYWYNENGWFILIDWRISSQGKFERDRGKPLKQGHSPANQETRS
jgi:hypothetical protein